MADQPRRDGAATLPRALVTGASSGIGAATATLLAREGYRVALLARRGERLAAVEKQLAADGHPGHLVLRCDLTEPAEIHDAMQRLGSAFGGLELLVNAAGIWSKAPLEEVRDSDLLAVVSTNFVGPAIVCREALPLLRKGRRPVVVNVSSVAGRRAVPGLAIYSASKAALAALGDALRIEWAHEAIAVCTLSPSGVSTERATESGGGRVRPAPGRRWSLRPEQVAQHVLDLARHPQPERVLEWRWRLRVLLHILFPRWSDRRLLAMLPDDWGIPRR